MPKNVFLKPRTAADIDRQVERVLNGLGNPEPPLDLRLVRDLLELDHGYYSAKDPGLLQETVHKLRVGASQVLLRPSLLIDAVKKFDLRALYIPDQKRILLDKDQPKLKHRWNEAHEIGHSILPWHEGAMLGDDDTTLIPSCHAKLENEANAAAGRLLFLNDRFFEEARSLPPKMASLKELSKRYGNTNTSTLWRCIEAWGHEVPIIGLITGHPHPRFRDNEFDLEIAVKHFIQSPTFASQFSNTRETDVFDQIVDYCSANKSGPLGHAEVLLLDDNGDQHIFEFESFSFYYQTLTIGLYKAQKPIVISASVGL